jgi:O-antigen/teichoic acid export membrane protein
MLNSIRTSIKDTFVFGFGNIAVKIVGFILIPLYTDPKFFSVDDFGIMGLLDISGLVLISLIATSLPQSLSRWYWAKDQSNNQKEIFFMTIVSQIILSLLFCCLLLPFSGQLSALIFSDTNWSFAISLLIISSALQAVNNIVATLLRLKSRSLLFTISNLLKLIVVLFLTIYFIISRHLGIAGIYLAQVVGNLLFILFLSPFTIRNCKVHFDYSIWKSMMIYGLPLIIASFSGVLLNVIDRYSLNSLALLKYVAIYTLAFKISSSLKLVFVDTIKLAIFPQMVRRVDTPDNKRFYSKAMLYTSFIVMFAIIGVSLFSLEVIKVITKSRELWGAFMLVPLLALSTFFMNMREVSIYGLIVTKKTSKISLIVIISAVLNLLLNLWFIPLWNAMGAALATLLSQLFYWSVMHFTAQKTYFVPYENKKIIMIFILGTLLSFTGLLLNDINIILRLIIKIACLGSFPFILYLLNFYEPVELQSIRGFFNKWSDIRNFRQNLASLKNIKDDM